MKDITTSILSVLVAAILCLLVITDFGLTQYKEDQFNCLDAAETFVDRVVDAAEINDYFITELNNAVSSSHGVYTTEINKYTVVSNSIPGGGTYITEYLGKTTDKLVTGDRIEVIIKIVRYPSSMTLIGGLTGVAGSNMRMFKVSGTVR